MGNIIVHGSTLGSNFGDCLFAELFFARCEENYEGETLFYENSLPFKKEAVALSDHFREAIGYNNTCNFSNVRKAEGIVFMPGGYFGETTPSLKEAILRYYKHVKLGLYAKWFNIPLAIIGVEVGPLSRRFMRTGARIVFRHASVIAVRNVESKLYLQKLGIDKEIYVTSDAAIVIGGRTVESLNSEIMTNIKNVACGRRLLMLHCVTPDSQLEIVSKKIIPALNSFLVQHDYSIVLTVDQCSLDRRKQLEHLKDQIDTDFVYIYQYKSPSEFVALINEMDCVITTKLHVGIVGSALHKSVVSVPFNSHKVPRFYNQIGYGDRCIPMKEASTTQVLELLLKYHDKNVELSNEIMEKAELNYRLLDDFLFKLGE